MRLTALLLILLVAIALALSGDVGAQCFQSQPTIYHYHTIPAPAPVLIHSRVIESAPVPQPPATPASQPTKAVGQNQEGCVVEGTNEDEEGTQRLNFGVVTGKLGATPRYRLNGVEVSRDQAIAAVEGAEIPDDTNLLRITLIGSKEDRSRVAADLANHPALSHLKGKVLVQDYDSTDPLVNRRGFICTGKPSIYVSAPDGKVLARNTDGEYRGPEALAYAIGEAGGKPYTPDNDKPLPVKPEPTPPPAPVSLPRSLSDVPSWAWIAGAAVLFLYLQKKGGNP